MHKQGVIRTGKTPSAVSGEKSETIKKGEALRYGEDAPLTESDLDTDSEEGLDG